ncbi:M16 family metallopeptidase [Arcticibacter eurypsychrophilus]|uniref:M16 family metallopeptidase n=1 Tax=Arcticibacter eurypsychrophilus TaxID=1434752 RepID=UPI00084E04AE|nr:pitrilysin family protein [Arcticibacter eurypsychrophilus]
MDYEVFTLPNGIRLLFKPTVSSVSHACIIINTGSRDEPEEKDGLAHFIEHLLFKKTEKRSTNQILNYLEAVGGDLNAYTTKEYTCIHASFLIPYLRKALDLFEDLVFHSLFPVKEMEKEKGVIMDEIASYQDQPEEAIQDDFEDLLFSGHSLGRNILGSADSVTAFQQQDIFSFLTANYNTEEIVIGVNGNYTSKEVNKLFTSLFENIPANRNKPCRLAPNYTPVIKTVEKSIAQTHCVLGNQAYSIHDSKKTGLLVLNNILGGNGMSSILNLIIREKYGIAYTIESNYTPMCDSGIFSIYFGTDAEKSDKALKLVYKQLALLRDSKMTDLNLSRAKKKINGQIALGEDNRMGLIIGMCKSLIDHGRAESIEEVFAKINAITSNELLEIANEIFNPATMSTLTFVPDEAE